MDGLRGLDMTPGLVLALCGTSSNEYGGAVTTDEYVPDGNAWICCIDGFEKYDLQVDKHVTALRMLKLVRIVRNTEWTHYVDAVPTGRGWELIKRYAFDVELMMILDGSLSVVDARIGWSVRPPV